MGARARTAMKVESRTKAARNSKRLAFFTKKKYNTAQKAKATPASKKDTRYYPAEDTKIRLTNSHNNSEQTKLRSSITPGTVLILLAGRHKGKRVAFLKQLESGLLLVTGPYKVNGVPLRRVPQSYVIATKTKINVDGLDIPVSVSEGMFAREGKKKKSADAMFEEAAEGYKPSDERKEAQQAVDDQILPKISEVDHMRKYMSSLFTLRKGQYPHAMVF